MLNRWKLIISNVLENLANVNIVQWVVWLRYGDSVVSYTTN